MSASKEIDVNERYSIYLILFFTVISLLLISQHTQAQCMAGDIGGKVFMDLPMNGTFTGIYGSKASNEPGISGVAVKITDNNGTVSNRITDEAGNWNVSAPVFPVKIEFSWKTSHPTFESSPIGSSSQTSVQIIKEATCSADFGLHNPLDFTDANPYIATTCFVGGTSTGNASNDAAIVSVRYNSTGLNAMYKNYLNVQGTGPLPQVDAKISQVGSVYGLAYQRGKKRMFFSTFLKRHVGILDGPGYIYVLDYNTTPATFVTKFNLNGVIPNNGVVPMDFGTVCRSGTCGTPESDYVLNPNKTQATIDIDAYGKVGKVAYGDMDVAPDGKTLFAINLFTRSIITIDISGNTLPGAINEYKIDNIPNMPTSTKGVLRPFALAFNNGKGYLGVTDDASISKVDADLKCYVLEFDPTNPSAGFTQKMVFDPNARRGTFTSLAKFHYWNTIYEQPPVVEVGGFLRYSQPILSDIDFDQYGTMYLSIMDRHAHQIGAANRKPLTGNTQIRTVQAYGEILKACNTSSGFVLEGGTGCSTTGYEFFADISGDASEESGEGSSLLIKGTDQIMTTNFDPFPGINYGQTYWNLQGMNTYSTTTGLNNNWYAFYFDGGPDLFGKANGLGDLELVANDAPIEIGNRVWKDINENGIQDPNESGIAGVVVKLYDNNDVELASTTTDSNGQYLFSSTTTSTLLPNTDYKIKITSLGNDVSVAGLSITRLSIAPNEVAASTNSGATIDNNDAFLVSNIPTILIKTGSVGINNHTYDFGFLCKPTADAGLDKTINCITNSTTIGTSATTVGYTYSWSPSTGLSNPNISNPTASPNVTTTYTLTVTNAGECIATDVVVVTVEMTPPIANAGIDKILNCTTTSTTIGTDNTVGVRYSWSPIEGLNTASIANPTANPSVTTTYTLTVTNSTGCTATDAVTVSINQTPPTPTISGSENLNCTINTVTRTATGGSTYVWSGPNSYTASTASATISAAGIYTVTVTSENGCTATATTNITANLETPNANAGNDVILTCNTSIILLNGSSLTSGVSYVWSSNTTGIVSGENSATPTVNQVGTYTLTVTNPSNGCTATDIAAVILDAGVPSVAILASDDTLTCTKTQAILTANPSPISTYTFLWSNGATVSSITIEEAGTYSVEVTATNGCKAVASLIIAKFDTVTAQVDVTDVICKDGNTGTISIVGSGGLTPYQYKLNGGLFQSDNVFRDLTSDSYSVSIKDAGGCTSSLVVTVNEPSNFLSTTISTVNITCEGGNDGQILTTATGGTPNYTFKINQNNIQTDGLFSGLTAGSYTITTYDGNGCISTATTTLTQPSKINIGAVATMIDCINPKGTISVVATGGTPSYQYTIDGTNFQSSNSFNNLNKGTYTITVKDLKNCIGTATAAIIVGDTTKPSFIVTTTMATCNVGIANNNAKISVSNVLNGVKYQFSEGNTFNSLTATPSVAAAIPINGVLSNSLANPSTNVQFYTVRIYNSNDCYQDVTVGLTMQVCACKTEICIPFSFTKTKSLGQ